MRDLEGELARAPALPVSQIVTTLAIEIKLAMRETEQALQAAQMARKQYPLSRTDGDDGLVLHDRAPLETLHQIWMTEQGQMIFQNAHRVAMLDDRDIVQCLPRLRWRGSLCDDSQLLDWLEAPDDGLCFLFGDQALPVGLVRQAEMATTLGFVARPRLDAN